MRWKTIYYIYCISIPWLVPSMKPKKFLPERRHDKMWNCWWRSKCLGLDIMGLIPAMENIIFFVVTTLGCYLKRSCLAVSKPDSLTERNSDIQTSWHPDILTLWHPYIMSFWYPNILKSWHPDILTSWLSDILASFHSDILTSTMTAWSRDPLASCVPDNLTLCAGIPCGRVPPRPHPSLPGGFGHSEYHQAGGR